MNTPLRLSRIPIPPIRTQKGDELHRLKGWVAGSLPKFKILSFTAAILFFSPSPLPLCLEIDFMAFLVIQKDGYDTVLLYYICPWMIKTSSAE